MGFPHFRRCPQIRWARRPRFPQDERDFFSALGPVTLAGWTDSKTNTLCDAQTTADVGVTKVFNIGFLEDLRGELASPSTSDPPTPYSVTFGNYESSIDVVRDISEEPERAYDFCDGDKRIRLALTATVLLLASGIPVLTYNMGPGPNLFVPPVLGIWVTAALFLTRGSKTAN